MNDLLDEGNREKFHGQIRGSAAASKAEFAEFLREAADILGKL